MQKISTLFPGYFLLVCSLQSANVIQRNATYQTVMRSCCKPGKILSNAQWERKSPEGDAFGKQSFPSEARSAEKKKRPFRPQSLLSAVFRSIRQYFARLIRRSNDGLLDSTVQKQRWCVVLTVKFNYNLHNLDPELFCACKGDRSRELTRAFPNP